MGVLRLYRHKVLRVETVMAKRKPLHMGKSLSELNAHVTTTKVKSASPKK